MARHARLIAAALLLAAAVGAQAAGAAAAAAARPSAASDAEPKLRVHIVCHSHDDSGWLKTVDQ